MVGVLGTKAYFINDSGQLCKTDGTLANTKVVTTIAPGITESSNAKPLATFQGNLIFDAFVGEGTDFNNYHVFRTGGSSATTVDLGFGLANQHTQAIASDTQVYFNSRGDSGSFHLSVSGGAAGDTLGLPAAASDIGTFFNDLLYFGAGEPWVTDGTSAGTMELANLDTQYHSNCPSFAQRGDAAGDGNFPPICIPTGSVWEEDSVPKDFVSFNGDVYFSALGSLYKSAGGTEYPQVIAQGSYHSIAYYPGTQPDTDITQITACDGHLFFRWDQGGGHELWMTDGTGATLKRVSVLPAGNLPGAVDNLVAVGNILYYTDNDGEHGSELWRTDGSQAGTFMVADIVPGGPGSAPGPVCFVNGRLYFAAATPNTGRELWTSDGTAAGTKLVKDLNPGAFAESNPGFLVNGGGILYFAATDAVNGRELWQSDGTADGTRLFQDLRTGALGSDPSYLTVAGSKLYFQANGNDGLNFEPGTELWVIDLESISTAYSRKIESPVLQANVHFGAALAAAKGIVAMGLPGNAQHAGNVTLWASKGMNYLGVVENPEQNKAGSFASALAFAANGKVLAVGNPQLDSGATSSGAVYLVDSKTRGILNVLTQPGTPQAGGLFGAALAGSSSAVAVGAPGMTNEVGAAAVYPLKSLAGAFGLNSTLNAAGRRYGTALAFSGSFLGVTSQHAVGSVNGACEAFLASTGQFATSFNGGETQDGFGETAAGSKKLLAVSAPQMASYNGAPAGGGVYLIDAKHHVVQRVIINPDKNSGDRFGESIAFTSKGLLIGAPGTSTVASDAGAAYLFDLKTGNLLQTWNDPASHANDNFGAAVAWEAKAGAIVSAPGSLVQGVPGAGVVYTFTAK
jgi:ELWxxDGT repeat protein